MGLTLKEKQKVTKEIAERYYKAKKGEKKRILDEFTLLTGYNRKYAICVLNGSIIGKRGKYQNRTFVSVSVKAKVKKKRVYVRYYDEAVQTALILLWQTFDYLCAQRLVVFIKENLCTLAADPFFAVTDEVKTKLAKISSATISRLLKSERKKYALKGISTTKRGGELNALIPIRVFFDWDERVPGFFEMDTVAHGGSSAEGEFCYTLTFTDVCTGWTELRALKNKAHRWVKEALIDIQKNVPYRIRGIDSDNGGEFKNYQVLHWCEENNITFTRGRPYKKNDNCFVEQKNYSVVRHLVGYQRYEGEAAHDALVQVYKHFCPLNNLFYPSMRLIAKERYDQKVYKKYDLTKTPCSRSLESPLLSDTEKRRIDRLKTSVGLLECKKHLIISLTQLKQSLV